MRIYALRDDEKKGFSSVLPDSIDPNRSLIIVSVDDKAGNTPVAGLLVLSTVAAGIWRMDYLLVAEKYRRHGVAKDLMAYGTFLIQTMGASQLLTIILHEEKEEDTESLKQFLVHVGFSVSSARDVSVVSINTVCDELGPYLTRTTLKGIQPLSKITNDMWEEISSSIIEMMQKDDLVVPIYEKNYYRTDISMVMLDDVSICHGMILISDIDGDLSVDYLWSRERNGVVAMGLLSSAVNAVKNECNVLFDAKSEPAQRLAGKLFGEDLGIRCHALEMTLSL